jgi:hypothetical protein
MSVIHRAVATAAAAAVVVGAGLAMMAPASALASPGPFIGPFSHLKNIALTVPANGDVNPYGVAVVRHSQGRLQRGDVLVSNFNNSHNLQGTGSTIVEVSPTGQQTLFAQITRSDVADTGENRITAIPGAVTRLTSAGTGFVLTSGGRLNGPLGLTIAPNGDVLTVNGGDGYMWRPPRAAPRSPTSCCSSGSPPGSGALFGLAVAPHGSGVYYVDDATNFLRLLH